MWDRLEIFSKTGGIDLDVRGREIILVIGFIYFPAFRIILYLT